MACLLVSLTSCKKYERCGDCTYKVYNYDYNTSQWIFWYENVEEAPICGELLEEMDGRTVVEWYLENGGGGMKTTWDCKKKLLPKRKR